MERKKKMSASTKAIIITLITLILITSTMSVAFITKAWLTDKASAVGTLEFGDVALDKNNEFTITIKEALMPGDVILDTNKVIKYKGVAAFYRVTGTIHYYEDNGYSNEITGLDANKIATQIPTKYGDVADTGTGTSDIHIVEGNVIFTATEDLTEKVGGKYIKVIVTVEALQKANLPDSPVNAQSAFTWYDSQKNEIG